MSRVDNEPTWEELVEQDDEDPGYENFSRIEFNLWTKDPGVLRAVGDLTSGLEGRKDLNHRCMMVLLLNLYCCWLVDPNKWLAYMRRKGNYRLCIKYNKNEVTYTGLTRCVDHLQALGHIDHALGFYFRGVCVEKGKCSRARLKNEFAVLLEEEYGFHDSVIRRHPDEETIILKDKDKVPTDYNDTGGNNATAKRNFLRDYNELLENTYIDLNRGDFTAKEKMWVDLSRKHNYRVFSNGKKTLVDGGRFYGGWWQGIPSELRLRILINCMRVVECDYSGIHIYLLYAQEGVDFNALGKDAYQLPEYEPTKEMRNFFKILLLTALNADSPESAKKALNLRYTRSRNKFPAVKPDIDAAIENFSNYHKPISHRFYESVGHRLMNIDSAIAEFVLRRMTAKDIPTLSVHDSFICPKVHEQELIDAMRDAFHKHCGFNLEKAIRHFSLQDNNTLRARPKRTPRAKIKHEEQGTHEELGIYSDEFTVDIQAIRDESLLERIISYERDGVISKYCQIYVPEEPENGSGANE